MVIKKNIFKFLTLLVLMACASGLKEQMRDYRKSLEQNDFAKAQSILEKSVLKEDQRSKLLWHLELGSINLLQKNYDEAIKNFQTSLEIIDESYTKRISSMITSAISDDRDDFAGAGYERSLAHYYLARAYYERYLQKGQRSDLFGARAAILAWDTYFQTINRSPLKSIYRTDLMLKIFGGQIHEQINTRNDGQIALQLYKDAYKMAESMGGIFSYFNEESKEFIKNLEAGKDNKKFKATAGHQDFMDFLKYKILSLTYDLRRYEFDKMAKDLNASPEVISRAKKMPNVSIILEEGLVAKKVGREFNFGIKGAIDKVDDKKTKDAIVKHGVPMIGAFAMNILGLAPKNISPGSFIFAHQFTTFAVSEMAIQFQLPMIEEAPKLKRLALYVMDENSKVLEIRPLALVTQTSDLARTILEEEAVSEYVRKGTRVALKHLTAIAASFVLYNQLKTPENDFIARSVALASYVGSAKLIGSLEEADTRQWVSLPEGIRLQEFDLRPGKYKLGLGAEEGEKWPENPSKILGEIKVGKNKELFTFRL